MRKILSKIFIRGNIDTTLLFTAFFLIAFGIVMVYSSSSYYSIGIFGNNSYFLTRQLVWVGLGLLALFMLSFINYKVIFKLWLPAYLIISLMLVYVYFLGEENYGASRWIKITDSISFQPSELAKIVLIIVFAVAISKYRRRILDLKFSMFFLIFAAIPIGLIGLEDYSTAFIVLAIFGGMYFIGNKNIYKQSLVIAPLGFVALFALYKTRDYRSDRIDIWMKGPMSDPLGKGHQILQSFYAIGAGGVFGVGLGKSVQKMGSLPFAYNDVIFAIICEELGLFGGFTILILFTILLYRLYDLSVMTEDMMAKLFLIGLMIQIGAQVFIHVGVATNLVPATGIPLPFISYGGTSLLVIMIELGIALNISKDINRSIVKDRSNG